MNCDTISSISVEGLGYQGNFIHGLMMTTRDVILSSTWPGYIAGRAQGGYDKLTCTQISDDVMPSEIV